MAKTTRAERANATRDLILTTAERLFAERGLYAVSNRHISEAAGQGNNTAVGYHFGTKADLIRAILRKHGPHMRESQARLVAEAAGSTDVRVWVACTVRPITEHLDSLGSPTWFARFVAQVMTDPGFRDLVITETLDALSLAPVIEQVDRLLPELPVDVRLERNDMARQLVVHMCAERERALADGAFTPRATWHAAQTGLVDAIVGILMAPVGGAEE